MYILLAIVILIVLAFVILSIRSNRAKLKNQQSAERFVGIIFAEQSYRPAVKASWSYGLPSFSLCFETTEEKNHAEANGLCNAFIKNIQELCGDIHPRGELFDANLAVSVFSKSDEERWVKEASSIRKD
ncbi:hypothetical protein [Shewanella marisflavi]|uniref:hypothetical protein n=1 Tax=Shewanella marisflavi TaxID=260364 RepID=UPI003AAB015B